MTEPDNHPFKKFFGRHWELFAAMTSGFVGALALATSTYNVYLQRQQVRASVWPHLTIAPAFSDDGALSIVLRNRGVGPARLERVRVLVAGKPAQDWMDAVKMLLHKDEPPFAPDTSPLIDEVLTPGMELPLVKMPTAADSKAILRANEHTPFEVEVCYCSTLDDCWTLGTLTETKAVSGCPQDPRPFVAMTDATRLWMHDHWSDEPGGTDGGAAPR